MKKYTPQNPVFSDEFNIIERADLVNAQMHDASVRQVMDNTVALKNCIGNIEGSKPKFADGIESDNMVDAVNEVFQVGNERKKKLVENLVARGVPASTSDTWESLIGKVSKMSDISKDTVTAAVLLSGYTAHDAAGAKITGNLADKTGTTDYGAEASLDATNSRVKLKVPAAGKYGTGNYLYAAYNTIAALIGLTAAKVVKGNTILGIKGNDNNMDTSGGTAAAGDILSGKKAGVKGSLITGTLADKTGTADHGAEASLDATNSRVKLKVPAAGKYGTGNYLYAAYNTIAALIGLTAARLVKDTTVLGITGNSNNMDTSGGTAAAGDILSGKKAGVKGSLITGTMTNRGAWTGFTRDSSNVTIPAGYHDGKGYVSGAGAYNKGVSDADARTNADSANYKSGYSAGDSAGYNRGYSAGDSAGYNRGYSEGNNAGWSSGHTAGYSEGYSAGHADASANAKRWILLGTETAYNIKNLYPDLYAGLTTDNFMVAMDGSVSGGGEENEHMERFSFNIPKPTVNYDRSTGALTISRDGTYYWRDTANWGEDHNGSVSIPIKVYLLC